MNEKKKKRIVVGVAFLCVAAITSFYQYEYSKTKTDSKDYCVVAKEKLNIGDELTDVNVKIELRDKSDIPDGSINSVDTALGSIVTQPTYKNEVINENRVVSKEEYKKKDMKLVSIKCTNASADTLVGYNVKPYDKVDLLYFDSQGTYEGFPYIEGQIVYDLKSADGVSYKNKGQNFKPSYALIWVNSKQAEEINARQERGGYFKFQLHREKFNEEN